MNYKMVVLSIAVVATFLMSNAALAAGNGGSNKLRCFDGSSSQYPGTCSIVAGVATLDNSNGPYSGVFIAGGNLNGKTLSSINEFSLSYTGQSGNESPRIDLPIDTDGNGTADMNLLIPFESCSNGAGFINVLTNPTCVMYQDNYSTGYVSHNWSALIAAHPTWVASLGTILPYVLADGTGRWTVSNVKLSKTGK